MQFKIVGAHAESGDDVDVMLEAPSQNDVERIAHDRGILVASITALGAPAHAPAAPAHAPARKEEPGSIALIDDDPPAAGNGHAPAAERPHGIITTNANTPGESAHSAAGQAHHDKPDEHIAHYHIIMNQSLYLLESAVNKHLKDGWEVQGGLSVGMSNNALQFFQAMVKKPKA
ncbi:MAG TPA: hypothetical protein VHM90_10600 [Phycisphaerae bacterium]|jgi:hypothetical protein|nr:hypothetical protein [Phycisphaerae bacterium]